MYAKQCALHLPGILIRLSIYGFIVLEKAWSSPWTISAMSNYYAKLITIDLMRSPTKVSYLSTYWSWQKMSGNMSILHMPTSYLRKLADTTWLNNTGQ